MRWLVLKDLQILRRSPLLVSLLVAYPVVIAVLIGLALSAGPDKPKVAFVNLVPAEGNEFSVGGERLDASRYADELFKSIEPIRVRTRAEAVEKVRSGEALGALVIPEDATRKLQEAVSLAGAVERPTLEVIYNAEDPVKRRYVQSTIESRLAEANQALSERVTRIAGDYLGIVLDGGEFSLLGREFGVLGLRRAKTIVDATLARQPADSADRRALEQVSRFAKVAIDNLDLSDEVLGAVGQPVRVKQTVLNGARTPLDAYAVAVAVTISLMFVTVLLAAGLLALEREEHAYSRLVRGLVSRTELVAGKALLAAACAALVAVAMLGGLGAFVSLDWARFPLWVLAALAGALAFAALGVAVGALAREVRAASLLAILLSLPIAFLALVPSGSVSASLYDAVRAISAAFPFRPALLAIDSALNESGSLAAPLAHLAGLALAWGAVARLALRRFA